MKKEKSIKLTEFQLKNLIEAMEEQVKAQKVFEQKSKEVEKARDWILDAHGILGAEGLRIEGNELKYTI